MKLALQTYSVRDAFESEPVSTIETLGRLGLDGLEVWNLQGHSAGDVRRWLDAASLEACAFNMDLDEFEVDPAPAYRAAEALGTNRLVVSWLPPSRESAVTKSYATRLGRAAAAARSSGFELGFHLHAEEYDVADDGSVLVDRLVADAPDLFLEVDLGWAWIAGREVPSLFAASPGRFPIVHVKDLADRDDRESFVSVGEGAVPFGEMLRGGRFEWLVAEQDDRFEPDQLAAAARSVASVVHLRDSLGLSARDD